MSFPAKQQGRDRQWRSCRASPFHLCMCQRAERFLTSVVATYSVDTKDKLHARCRKAWELATGACYEALQHKDSKRAHKRAGRQKSGDEWKSNLAVATRECDASGFRSGVAWTCRWKAAFGPGRAHGVWRELEVRLTMRRAACVRQTWQTSGSWKSRAWREMHFK